MKIKTRINWQVRDKVGNLISEEEHDAHSTLQAFMQLLLAQMLGAGAAGFIDTGGVSRSVGPIQTVFKIVAAAGDATLGIVAGTGITAVEIDDYSVETLVAHGVGAGQLSYGTMAIDSVVTTVGSTVYFNASRTFTNSSGGLITITEIGLYGLGASSNYKFALDRTLSTKAIADTENATCTYKISISI